MKTAMIGDNCIDVYVRINGEVVNRRYPTGNCVDTGVNLQKLGIPTAIISTTGSDADGKWMIDALTKEGLDISHLKVGNGATAITYMDMNGNDRVHGDYIEGVLENIVFDEEDIAFAASHDLVHTALWGKAEDALPAIKAAGNIVMHGFVDIESQEFADILSQCGILLNPSVSEGGAVAVLNVLGTGALLPVCSRATGVDIGENGVVVDCLEYDAFEKALLDVDRMTPGEFAQKAWGAYDDISNGYTIEKYEENMFRLLEEMTMNNRK